MCYDQMCFSKPAGRWLRCAGQQGECALITVQHGVPGSVWLLCPVPEQMCR